jgi:alanyl-tRNA synthetase
LITRWAKIKNGFAIVLDKTPFYAESGGQIGDKGTITNGGIDLEVIDTQKEHDSIVHICIGDLDELFLEQVVIGTVDNDRRNAISRNHTATHLLHAALKEVLGEHVHQAGSSVGPENFRFDLTHFEKIISQELAQVETIVNNQIILNSNVISSVKSFDDAKKEGAEALFGEKYGDEVRVITIGKFSKELCGGTHVNRTGDIGLFKIIEESSLAAGVRRIIAITGQEAIRYIQKQNAIVISLQNVLRSSQDELVERAEQIVTQRKDLEKSLKRQKFAKGFQAKMSTTGALKVGDNAIIVSRVDASSVDELKNMGDELLSVIKSGVGVLGMKGESKPTIVVIVSPDLIKKGLHAGKIAKEIGAFMGGGGGGKPHLATAGGQDNSKLDEALKMAPEIIKKKLDELI